MAAEDDVRMRLAEEIRLMGRVEEAYTVARREVFDVAGGPPLTSMQRKILVDLETAEEALRAFRTPPNRGY